MEFYTRLMQLIQEKGLTVSGVEKASGISNASIKRWESQSPRLDSVAKLAKYLNVSIDYLAYGISESSEDERIIGDFKNSEGLMCDGSPLDNNEADLVAMYRLIPERQKEELFDFAYFKYKRFAEHEKAERF